MESTAPMLDMLASLIKQSAELTKKATLQIFRVRSWAHQKQITLETFLGCKKSLTVPGYLSNAIASKKVRLGVNQRRKKSLKMSPTGQCHSFKNWICTFLLNIYSMNLFNREGANIGTRSDHRTSDFNVKRTSETFCTFLPAQKRSAAVFFDSSQKSLLTCLNFQKLWDRIVSIATAN